MQNSRKNRILQAKHDHKVLIVCLIIITLFLISFFLQWNEDYEAPGTMAGAAAEPAADPFSGVPKLPMMEQDDSSASEKDP